jgi:hypothetical protein
MYLDNCIIIYSSDPLMTVLNKKSTINTNLERFGSPLNLRFAVPLKPFETIPIFFLTFQLLILLLIIVLFSVFYIFFYFSIQGIKS